MRSALALGLLITLCASANPATVHRFKPPEGTSARTSVLPSDPANAVPPRRASRFLVGPTNRPNTGWITPAPAAAFERKPASLLNAARAFIADPRNVSKELRTIQT